VKALVLIALLGGTPVEPSVEVPRRGPGWIISASAGGAFVVTATVLTVLAHLAEAQLRSGNGIATYSDVQAVRGRGETMQVTGIALFGCAAVAALAAFILYFR
jgi:hypothetical protein